MFDYVKLQDELHKEMESTFQQWQKEHDSIYMVSLDCSREMNSIGLIANTKGYLAQQVDEESEEYWYYKYCEEEWELFHTFSSLSSTMREYKKANQDLFTDPETCLFTPEFDRHCEKVIEACKNALLQWKESSLAQSNPNLLLAFYIREYFEEEERAEIFEMLNGETAAKEYAEHTNDFV